MPVDCTTHKCIGFLYLLLTLIGKYICNTNGVYMHM